MKKAINKSEREHILIQLVAHACTATGTQIVEELAVLRRDLHAKLLAHWQSAMPGIKRKDQLALLQDSCANSLTFQPTVYALNAAGKSTSVAEFCKVSWRNDGMGDSKKARLSKLASEMLSLVPGRSKAVIDGVSTSYASWFYSPTVFADIIRSFQPTFLYREGAAPDGAADLAYGGDLLEIHDKVVIQLTKLKDLLFSAEDMYHDLGAAIAPLKTAHALAEAMPEAVKHFPASLTYVKPTKEIADPAAINEIRAKLKKGLPI